MASSKGLAPLAWFARNLALIWLLAAAGASGGPSLPLQGPRAFDGRAEDEGSYRIEWKENWDATYKGNVARWEAEAKKLKGEQGERDLFVRMRAVRLLEALAARYPNEAEKCFEARREVAGNYYNSGLVGYGNYVLKKIVEDFPGRLDFAAPAFHQILYASRSEEPWEVEEGPEWVEYAAPRLIALWRAGCLPEGHPSVIAALRAMAVLRRAQGRLAEARQALEDLEAHTGRDEWWLLAEAELYFAAGREREALPRYQDLFGRSEENGRARDRIQEIIADPFPNAPSYASQFGLEVKWDGVRTNPIGDMLARIGELLKEDAEGKSLLPWKDTRYSSLWVLLDRHLAAQEPAALAVLRKAQEEDARRLLRTSGASPRELLTAFRWYPWASASHQALLRCGEDELRRGHAGLALRAFQDVRSHASDAGTRSRAQVGAWLALAQDGEGRAALERAFEGVPADAALPWLGKGEKAKAIRERLAATPAPEAEPPPALSALGRATLRMPPVGLWPPVLLTRDMPRELAVAISPLLARPQPWEGGTLVAGPELLACFGDDPNRPLWTRTACRSTGDQGKLILDDVCHTVVPGRFQPAIADGRAFTRWGMDETHQFLTDVAAFDLRSGEMVWSTAGDPAWSGLWPAGDPAVADGRVYFLALLKGYASVLPVSSISLVCLDAQTGRVLWKRALASQNLTLLTSSRSNYREQQFDLAHYGSAVTVHQGAVYCLTNMGFAARCDARDGVVEWAANYPQVQLRWNVRNVVQQQGAPPCVVGGHVLFLPRDGQGAFALEASTGKMAWDNPFVPSAEAVGVADGLLLASDTRSVGAIDAATGRLRWHRDFGEGLLGRPMLAGSAVCVGTPSGLQRLAAATGASLEAADWGPAGPMPAFALRGRTLVGITAESVGSDREPTRRPLNPQAPAAHGPLRLPLAECWRLPRPNPTLWVPPPEAKLDGKLFLASRGVLECLQMTAQGAVEWQRGLEPGHRAVAWAEGALLLVYPRSVAAIDGSSGRLRWQTDAPFTIRQWQEAPPYLVLGDYEGEARSRRTCVLDLASGKMLWHRQFNEFGGTYENYFHGIGWDGKSIHLLSTLRLPGADHVDVVCQPKDGTITAIRPFLPKGREWPLLFDVGEKFGFYVDQSKVAYSFDLDGSQPHLRYKTDLHDLDPRMLKRLRRTRRARKVQSAAQWVQVYQYEDYPTYRHSHWVFQRGNPDYQLRRPRPGVIRGDRLFEIDGHQTVRVVDLLARKEVAEHSIQLPAGYAARVLDYQEEGDQMVVVSGVERGPYASAMVPYRLEVDLFDKATGQHRARQVLDDIPYWRFITQRQWQSAQEHETQVAWGDGLLFVTDADGLVALASSAAPAGPSDRVVHIAHQAPQPVAVDGWLEDWDLRSAIPVPGRGGRTGRLYLAHDDDNLYLALAFPSSAARPRRGCGDYGGGDWIELGLSTNHGSYHWGIGADGRNRAVWDNLDSNSLPGEARGAIRHDPLARQTLCEIALPLKEIVRTKGPRWRKLGLSLAVWEDTPSGDPQPAFAWGNGLSGQAILAEQHEALFVHPLTREGEEAGLAIADQLPELPQAWAFFQHSCEVRAPSPNAKILLDRYRDFLKRHPNGPPAARALVALDQTLRTGLDSEPSTSLGPGPTAEILKLAQEAGVADAVRSHYARLTKRYLSQWILIDPKKRPSTLMLQLYDGIAEGTWSHRVAWGADIWRDWGHLGTPSRQYAGPVPSAEGWIELRIPLIWLDLHETPVNGISFMQAGGGNIVWDRSAVVFDGGERVFLDDEIPKGAKAEGPWKWVGDPRRSGARAHTDDSPGDQDSNRRRDVWSFPTPVVEHVIPPVVGAYLSQWVYLNPAKPPRMVSIRLMGHGDTQFRGLWGEPRYEGRYMGPLPTPGQWQELRIPLEWTWLRCLPIHGIDFEQWGGQVTWDRTAIVRDGREQVIIEDETPQGSARGEAWTWVDSPVKSGKKAHTQVTAAEFTLHGVAYMREWFAQHLPFDARPVAGSGCPAAAVIQSQIPRMGPTDAAWTFYQALCDIGQSDNRRVVDLATWFLKTFPDHPNGVALLKTILDSAKYVDERDPEGLVEKVIEEAKVPLATRYAYRRKYGSGQDSFIRAWRVLGPFPNPGGTGHAKPYPPETEPVRLDKSYDVIGGQARWKFHASDDNIIDLAKLFKPNEHVVAYAVCWIYSDKGRFVSFEVGSDDGVKLWVNRKLELDHQIERAIEQSRDTAPAYLRQGWNEVLVKIEQGIKLWSFCVELLDREARGLLKEVTLSTTPPPEPKAEKK